MKCPCNPNRLYSKCCGIAHKNNSEVISAEQLMRSRYSAFVLGKTNYLYLSHHSATRPSKKEHDEIKKWTQNVQWLKLEVIHTTEKTVHFKAFYLENGQVQVIEENSEFLKENGHWVYIGAH